MAWSLYERTGERKYLTADERRRFLQAARQREPEVFTFCWLLRDTGCRVSEALALTTRQIDVADNAVVFESLKKRHRGIYRAVPLSPALVKKLSQVHDLQHAHGLGQSERRLWPWCRMTGYRRVKEVMEAARIEGPHASPKGLRHGFGVAALEAGIPLNLVQRWLGHADLATTAIYADASGAEERNIARRLWKGDG